MATGNRPGAGARVPGGGLAGGAAAAAAAGRPAVRHVRRAAGRRLGRLGPGYLGPAFGPFEVEGDPARGTLQVPRGVAPERVHAPRPARPARHCGDRFDRGLRALDSVGGDGGPRPLPSPGRWRSSGPTASAPRSTWRASRTLVRDDYGRTPLGQGALAARRLIEAGARFVTLGFGGWDTHGDNFRTLRDRLLPALDKALSALIRDLESRGLLDETIVVCAGEFGRTPRVNGDGRARPLGAVDGRAPGRRRVPRRRSSTARPTTAGRRPLATPAPPTTWPPRSSGGWASAPATRSSRPAAGRSRSSARADASRP